MELVQKCGALRNAFIDIRGIPLNQFQVIEFCCNRFLGIVFLKIFFIPNHNSFFLFAKGVNLEEKSCVSFENDTFKTCCRPTTFQQHLLAEALQNLSILDHGIVCKNKLFFYFQKSFAKNQFSEYFASKGISS